MHTPSEFMNSVNVNDTISHVLFADSLIRQPLRDAIALLVASIALHDGVVYSWGFLPLHNDLKFKHFV